jgi:nitroimidazol reductase NimA-like FMN-containing flavoprotein (pyridoxamine 5'-phosphate oxidase superfamily)
VRETAQDLKRLERTLDESLAAAGPHLRSVFSDERRMSPEQIVRALRGVFVLDLATIDASGAPLVSPIDGLFYRGHFWFGFPAGAARIQHVRARPRVSAAYTLGEDLCILAHGRAHEVRESDPEHAAYLEYAREVYTPEIWDYWQKQYEHHKGGGLTAWIEPRRMYATLMNPDVLT